MHERTSGRVSEISREGPQGDMRAFRVQRRPQGNDVNKSTT